MLEVLRRLHDLSTLWECSLVQACSLEVQLGVWLVGSSPFLARAELPTLEELAHIEGFLTLEHVVDRTTESVSQNAQGFAFAMLLLQSL